MIIYAFFIGILLGIFGYLFIVIIPLKRDKKKRDHQFEIEVKRHIDKRKSDVESELDSLHYQLELLKTLELSQGIDTTTTRDEKELKKAIAVEKSIQATLRRIKKLEDSI